MDADEGDLTLRQRCGVTRRDASRAQKSLTGRRTSLRLSNIKGLAGGMMLSGLGGLAEGAYLRDADEANPIKKRQQKEVNRT